MITIEGFDQTKRALLDRMVRSSIQAPPQGLIAKPGCCYVGRCDEPIVRIDGAPVIFRHKRFGAVHACAGHDPQKG